MFGQCKNHSQVRSGIILPLLKPAVLLDLRPLKRQMARDLLLLWFAGKHDSMPRHVSRRFD